MRGDPEILISEFAKDLCLKRAMDIAGYRGGGRIYEAALDIEERAHEIRRLICGGENGGKMERILREYERIAFASDEDVRVADKLKALDMYRILSGAGDAAGLPLVVNYDYGEDE